MAYFMLILFTVGAKNCKLYVSRNRIKWPEIMFNRDSLDEKKEYRRKREREIGLERARVKGRNLTQIKKFVCNK